MAASACAKFILGGEHSIVIKGRALAFALPQTRLYYSESVQESNELFINQQIVLAEQIFNSIFELRKKIVPDSNIGGLRIEIKSEIPMGAGLGSSAALCVAMLKNFYPDLSQADLAKKATECESIFHQKSSGLDTFTIAYEKPIFYRASDRAVNEISLDLFKNEELCFLLSDTGKCRSTHEVQSKVLKVKEETPLIYENLIDSLALNVEEMNKAILRRDKRLLGQIMNDSHFRLIQLGVSSDEINELCENLKSQGALGSKITGAGCGGYIVSLFEKRDLSTYWSSFSAEQKASALVWTAGPVL